jgi:hypothetical protein
LCLLGCLTLPDEAFDRAYRGQGLSFDEDRMFQAHPEAGARILSNIPRLELVAEIIRRQLRPEAEPSATEQSRQGAQVLNLALELDRRMYKGLAVHAALLQLRLLRRFDRRMLDALEGYSPPSVELAVRRCRLDHSAQAWSSIRMFITRLKTC